MDNVGTVTGLLTLPGDVILKEEIKLTIPTGASLIITDGNGGKSRYLYGERLYGR